jgi:hypothetical protein
MLARHSRVNPAMDRPIRRFAMLAIIHQRPLEVWLRVDEPDFEGRSA